MYQNNQTLPKLYFTDQTKIAVDITVKELKAARVDKKDLEQCFWKLFIDLGTVR